MHKFGWDHRYIKMRAQLNLLENMGHSAEAAIEILNRCGGGWTGPPILREQQKLLRLVKDAYEWSSYHRVDIESSDLAGCFSCGMFFGVHEIDSWIEGTTAICPRCGIDAVIPDSCGFLNKQLLELMHEYWF